jgi:hypothetical protein
MTQLKGQCSCASFHWLAFPFNASSHLQLRDCAMTNSPTVNWKGVYRLSKEMNLKTLSRGHHRNHMQVALDDV